MFFFRKTLISLLLFLSAFCLNALCALGQQQDGGKSMWEKFGTIKESLENNDFGIPVYFESSEQKNSVSVDVYGVLPYEFTKMRDALRVPANWCEIAPLHLNVKACTYRKQDDTWMLTLYNGRKFFQPPQESYQLDFTYALLAQTPDYLNILLSSGDGPFHTRDHRLAVEAAPLEGKTLVHFRYSYGYNFLGRLAMKSFFSASNEKTGFSVIDRDEAGNPVYSNGIRGAVERNLVRYYFAVEAFMDTISSPREQRFEERLNRWYDLTEKYPQQLFEMDKSEYLKCKRLEHREQLLLQG